MQKIIFIDIDGTLCNSQGEVSQETISMIKKIQEAGHIVVLSTGRRLNRIIPLMEKCQISSYILALNGAQIYDYENHRMILEEDIGFENCIKIYEFSKNKNLKVGFHTGLFRYTNFPYSDDILLDDDSFMDLENRNVAQVVFWSEDFSSILEVKREIEKMSQIKVVNQSRDLLYGDKKFSHKGSYIDIVNCDVSKGNSIKVLLNYLGISKEQAIAIGDGVNDLSMFEEVGTKVAMGNADPFLKEKADYITLSNDENGVAYYLEKLLQ